MSQSIEDIFETQECTEEEQALLNKHLSADQHFIHVGPSGYVVMKSFLQEANKIKNLSILPTDVFVVSMPRSGSTWTQEMVWLINNNMDFEKAKSIDLTHRYLFMEQFMLITPVVAKLASDKHILEKVLSLRKHAGLQFQDFPDLESPRFVKSHLPLSLLPKELKTAKVVYVARDPRDVLVSFYHFWKETLFSGTMLADFKSYYYDLYTKNLALYSPYFAHVKEAWAMRNHPNFLFLFYEELSKDIKGTARRVAEFFGKPYTEEQFNQLCSHLEFNNFRKNGAVDLGINLKAIGTILDMNVDCKFFRKGKAGGWREVFDEEMSRHAERWIEDNLKDTDLRFPQ